MIDLRKYILADSENPFCQLIKEVMQRTHCNTLDNIATLAPINNPDVFYSIALELAENLLQGCELSDYGEWGSQQSTEDCTGYISQVNPLLYALIMSVFEESQVSFKVFDGTEAEVLWTVLNAKKALGTMPDWESEALEFLAEVYRSSMRDCEEFLGADINDRLETGLAASIMLIKFDDSCDANILNEFMEICGKWIPPVTEGSEVYCCDLIGYEPSYMECGLQCNIPDKSEELIKYLKKYGHKKKKKISPRTDKTINHIVGELRGSNTTGEQLIREILAAKETRMEVML